METAGSVRQPAVAGLFYPDDPADLQSQVRNLMTTAAPGVHADPPPKALVAPHAGFPYSGPVAASAYAALGDGTKRIRRVVLVGPSHRVPFSGIATTGASAYRTPLGLVPIDRDAYQLIGDLAGVTRMDEAHRPEHSLEVHLPFLQVLLHDFALVPLVVGDADAETVAAVLDRLWGGEETLIVISSDLSHYHDYATAQMLDAETCDAIEHCEETVLGPYRACGHQPLAGLLRIARSRGLRPVTLDLRNSGDTAGMRREVVGYGAWAFR
jgi:MEMO1 family protein